MGNSSGHFEQKSLTRIHISNIKYRTLSAVKLTVSKQAWSLSYV